MTSPSQDARDRLPPGVEWQTFVDAVSGTGYPLQMYAARVLRERGFWVQEEWAYADREKNQRRALDIISGRSGQEYVSTAGASLVSVELLVECKRSRHPLVFFQAINPPSQADHPSPIYSPGKIKLRPSGRVSEKDAQWVREESLGLTLEIFKLPFIVDTPVAASMSIARANGKKVDMSGDEAYRELLLPLTKALGAQRARRLGARNPAGRQFIHLPLAVALVDAPMYLVRAPEACPEAIDHVRIFVRSAIDPERHRWKNPRIDFVEIVNRSTFVDFLEVALSRFIADFEGRINAHHAIVLSGEARVTGLTSAETLDTGILNRLVGTN